MEAGVKGSVVKPLDVESESCRTSAWSRLKKVDSALGRENHHYTELGSELYSIRLRDWIVHFRDWLLWLWRHEFEFWRGYW